MWCSKAERKVKTIPWGGVSFCISAATNHSMQLPGQVCPLGIFVDCGLWSEMKGGLGVLIYFPTWVMLFVWAGPVGAEYAMVAALSKTEINWLRMLHIIEKSHGGIVNNPFLLHLPGRVDIILSTLNYFFSVWQLLISVLNIHNNPLSWFPKS